MSLLAAIGLESEIVTVTRRAAGSRTKGLVTPGASSTLTVSASVQPITPRQAQMLPEGIRQSASFVVFSGTELKATDPLTGAVGDTISYRGRTWEIVSVEDWTQHGGFYKSVAAKVEV